MSVQCSSEQTGVRVSYTSVLAEPTSWITPVMASSFPALDLGGLPLEAWALPLMGIVAGSGHYRYRADLLQLEAATPTTALALWPRGPTPLRYQALQEALRSHPDPEFTSFILRGLRDGFRIGFAHQSQRLRATNRNHPSSLANPTSVNAFIAAELDAGRLQGPVAASVKPLLHTSPIGLVPKGHTMNRWRMIVDLSFPATASVNDGIKADLCSLRYATLDDALQLVSRLGRDSQLVKIDLKDAYRMIPIHPADHYLLAITWEGATYVDRSLPFGLRSAPKLFTAVADALAWALFRRGIRFLLHYLDDFLFIGEPDSLEAATAKAYATEVFDELGVPVASHKTEGPATCVTFLGIVIDTHRFQVRLPEDKLTRLKALVQEWHSKRGCSRRELESLLGHLSHAASVVRPGRLFLRQLFALLPAAPRPHHHLRLNLAARADLHWWEFFLQEWNGISLLTPAEPSVHIYSDAAGKCGCGAFDPQHEWFNAVWPPHWAQIDIAVKELTPVVLAAAIWGHSWAGKHVKFHVDNIAVVAVVQKLNARDLLLCHLLRCLYFYAAYFRFRFSATHIPGAENTAADALSRANLSLFHSLFPQVLPATVPLQTLALFLNRPPDWNSSEWTAQFRDSLQPELHQQPLQPTAPESAVTYTFAT